MGAMLRYRVCDNRVNDSAGIMAQFNITYYMSNEGARPYPDGRQGDLAFGREIVERLADVAFEHFELIRGGLHRRGSHCE
jgi:hypothetical protein